MPASCLAPSNQKSLNPPIKKLAATRINTGTTKMKYYVYESLRNFNFWSGAKDTVDSLTPEQIDEIENMMEDCDPEGWSDTDINDFFWFQRDTIAEWLGFNDWEDLENNNKE